MDQPGDDRPRLWVAPLGAVVAFAMWQYELLYVVGWAGTAWVGIEACVLPIIGVTGLTVLFARPVRPLPAAVFFVLHLGLVRLVYAATFVLPLYVVSQLMGQVPDWVAFVAGITTVGLIPLGYALGLWVLMRLVRPVRLRWVWLWSFLLTIAVPLGVLTGALVPAHNGDTDLFHAVKMGWPAAWTVLLVGWMTALPATYRPALSLRERLRRAFARPGTADR